MEQNETSLSLRAMLDRSERFVFEEEYPTESLMNMYARVSETLDGMPESFHIKAVGEQVLHTLSVELRFRGMVFDAEQQLALMSQVPHND